VFSFISHLVDFIKRLPIKTGARTRSLHAFDVGLTHEK